MKRKLFLLLCALLTMIGVQAGTDVTNTYLTNADFSVGTPIDNHVCTYGKDMAANNTTYYGAQEISGWTNASKGITDGIYPNCGVAGAMFEYGSSRWVAGAGTTVPAAGPSANPGNAAGLCAVWGNTIQYTQNVTLPAGHYTVKFQVYNSTTNNGSGKFITTNLFGFDADEGDDYYSPATTFAIGQWTTVTVTFTLAEEKSGKISMGYVAANAGNANMPHLFVDNVKILSNTDNTDKTSSVGLQANDDWKNAGDGMQGSGYSTDDGRSAGCAARYGTSAVANDVIYQDITGLPEGNYEVEVYALSQNEWNNHGASLKNDKGDAVYVFATGTSTVKTYINARRGPGLNANGGPKVYSISNVITEDGNLRLGLGIDIANQTEWHMIQIKSLKRVGSAFEALVTAYETALSDAKTMSGTSAKMSATALTALNNAIDTYDEGKVDKSDKDALIAATNALNEAIDNASASLSVYANINTAIGNYATKAAALDASGAAAYDDSDVTTKYNNGTYATLAEAEAELQADYFAAIKAQTTAGGNWTELISNPSFETNNFNGWTNSGLATQGNTSFTLKAGSYYAEAWQPNGTKSVKQTVSDMPIGSYRISAAAFARGVTSAKIFVNNNEKAVTIGADAATYSIDFTCDNGTDLEIGFEAVCTGADASWICVDNFTLTYVGSLDDGFDAAVENVTSLEGTIPTAAYNKAYAVVQKWKDNYPTTVSGFETAIAEINSAANEAATCVAPYAAYNQKHTEVQALYDVDEYEELTSGAHEALGTALTTAATNINNAENVDGINAVISTLVSAGATYAGKANPTNEAKPFDLTFMLVNPDVTSYWNGTWGIQPAGWYTDQTGGNFQVMANEEMGPGGEVFMEYWSENARTSNFSLYQKVTLDKGTYRMTGRVGLNQDTGGNNANMTFSANETNGTKIAAGPLSDQEVEFVNTADETEVKIGIKAQAGNTYRWIGINKIKLYEIPAKTYTVDETQDWDNTTSGAGDVTLKRTIKVGLNTVVFPFSMTQAEVESTFGAGSKVYVVSAYEESTENISFVTQDGILPNQPCLLKATVAGTSYDLEGRTIVAAASAAPAYVLESVSMIGGYNATNDIAKDDYNYVISGGKIYFVDSDGVTMKGTRAYIKVASSNPARELFMFLDGEATAISTIDATEEDGALKDGKYLIDGKVILVKNGVKYSANGQILK